MVYLRKTPTWPEGAVHLTGSEPEAFRTRGQLQREPVYLVLGRTKDPDWDKVRSMADAFFRGSDVSSYTACKLGKVKEDGHGIVVHPSGALVVLRDGTRYLLATGTDGRTRDDGVTLGFSKDVILNDRD